MRHREIRPEEFAPELAPLVSELQRGVSPTEDRHRTMAELVRALEMVKSTLPMIAAEVPVAGRWRMLGVVAAAFILGSAATAAAFILSPAEERVAAPVEPAETAREEVKPEHRPQPYLGGAASETPLAPPATPPAEDMAAARVGPQDIATPASPPETARKEAPPKHRPRLVRAASDAPPAAAQVDPQDTATPVPERPSKPARATTWEARMRKAEATARRCLDAAGVEPSRPLVVTILPNAPAEVAGVRSDSTHARCIREALGDVSDQRRRHTFFAP